MDGVCVRARRRARCAGAGDRQSRWPDRGALRDQLPQPALHRAGPRLAMVEYAESSSVRDARTAYFLANGFSDAGYRDAWVHLKVLGIPVAFPNTRSRKRAVPLHDLHHVATGYSTTLIG